MTVSELIELLQDFDGNAEVRLMTQQNWPFENAVHGVVDTRGMAEFGELHDDAATEAGDTANIVYVVEGAQLKYGSKLAWAQ